MKHGKQHQGVHRLCPLCGADNAGKKPSVYSQDEWIIKKCSGCGLVYLENPPAYEELEEIYAWEKTSSQRSQERTKKESALRQYVRKIERYKDRLIRRDKLIDLSEKYFPVGPVIDVGCGGGAVMSRLDKKHTPYGIEVSKQLSGSAQEIATARGGHVFCGNALEGLDSFDKDYFVAAIMSAYFEHEAAPREVLQKIKRVLRPGAPLVIKVPNYGCLNRLITQKKWCGFRYPDHVNYWTPRTLKKIIADTGFDIVRFNIGDRSPISDNMWLIARKPA
ncbi:MAG: class I SAM-dependent methyltransferase [Smithella sp.]|nr:class I SAM-dependent methyltransferase [Smithella sp.]